MEIHSYSSNYQITYIDTKKAWEELINNSTIISPESNQLNETSLYHFYSDNESVKSLPTHNIPYMNSENVLI